MIWLAFLIATWAVFGAGRQVSHDARAGIATARARTAQRVTEIRADKKAKPWKRRTATAAVGTAKFTGATYRGARHVGRSAWTGAKWGVAEGRKRHAERAELRQVKPLSDADDRQPYRQVRDRILHDRAERAGRPGMPARKVRRIAKRDAAEDERLAAERDDSDGPAETPPAEPEQPPAAADEPEPKPGDQGEGDERAWQAVTGQGGDPGRYAPMARAQAENQHNGSINGGTDMTAPTSNGFRASGEATTISGARAAWASFEGYAVEMFDTAGQAEQEAKARQAGAAQMLDVATAAETDAKQQMTAAQTLAASLADSDMGDPQAVADAEAQQESAAGLAAAAAELRTEAENIQASAAHQAELAGQLRALAETSQSHAATSLQGLNERNARREAFFKD
jgi:hypothetical protein